MTAQNKTIYGYMLPTGTYIHVSKEWDVNVHTNINELIQISYIYTDIIQISYRYTDIIQISYTLKGKIPVGHSVVHQVARAPGSNDCRGEGRL